MDSTSPTSHREASVSTSSEELKLWQVVGGFLLSALGGAATAGWVARGMLEKMQQRLQKCELDNESLKNAQAVCKANLANEMTKVVELAIANHTIQSMEQFTALRKEIVNLATVFDRRKDELVPTPHGERRDQ
jgi:hypothetical protein